MKRLYLIITVILASALLLPLGCGSPDTEPATTVPAVDIPPVPPDYQSPVAASGDPLTTFINPNFAGSGRCSSCHGNLYDNNNNEVSIDNDWRATMMANASKDPLWQAKVSSETTRHPELETVIDDKCTTCHMPMAHTAAIKDDTPVAIFNNGFNDGDNSLHDAAMDGVSCTLCHQIRNDGLGEDGAFSGAYPIDTTLAKPSLIIYGPFPAASAQVMSNSVGFIPQFGEQTLDSGLCATCHTLYTPVVNAAGDVIGTFPEQTPYLEWEHSDFGNGGSDDLSCQQCHMPAADTPVQISTMPRRLSAREPFAQHYFVGGNTLLQGIMAANNEVLELTVSTSRQDVTRQRTLNQLENDTATLNISSAVIAEDELSVTIDITNKAGHKFPTGFPARRAWLYVAVSDAGGNVVFESGRPDENGLIAGVDDAAAAYSPHYDVISDPSQVQIYETVMQDTSGEITHTLLEALQYAKDNRLLPQGFDKVTADADFAVYGKAAADESFQGGSDSITYRIALGDTNGPYSITVRFYYQTLTPAFTTDLFRDESTAVAAFQEYYDQAYRWPVTIAGAEAVVK